MKYVAMALLGFWFGMVFQSGRVDCYKVFDKEISKRKTAELKEKYGYK